MRKLGTLASAFEDASALVRRSALSGSTTLKLLELLGTALECDWGTYWKVDSESHVLRPAVTWCKSGPQTEGLDRNTKSRCLSLSEGTAGHVWRSRKPVWTTDLLRDMCLPRSLEAEGAGFRGGIWFPLKTEDTVYAILEFLGTSLPSASTDLLLGLEVFGIELGNLIATELREKGDS